MSVAAPKNEFNLNRPIHLARRDAHFERAVELLYMPIQELDVDARIRHVEKILHLLRSAQHHAFLASKSAGTLEQELEFLRFLTLVTQNVQSALSMMQHQTHLAREGGFLCSFLSASPDECALPALHYQRRADDILEGLWHLMRLAHRPYRELQRANFEHLLAHEQSRYRRAYDSFRTEARERFPSESKGAPLAKNIP